MHPCMEAIPSIAIRVNVLLVCMRCIQVAVLGTDATTVYAGILRRYTFVASDDCYCYVR